MASSFLADVDLAVRHAPLSSTDAAQLPGNRETGARPLERQFAFHLGQTRHDMEKEPARGRDGIDRIGEAFELHALLVQLPHHINKMPDAAPKTVQLLDNQGVVLAQHFNGLGKPGPVGTTAAQLVIEDLLAPGPFHGSELKLQISILR